MPTISFGKGQGFSHIPTDALAEGIVPAFNMGGFAGVFADAPMRFDRKDGRVGVPEIAETHASPVRGGNSVPEPPTRAFASVANHEGDDLAGPAAQRHPEPPFPGAFPDKRPDFIEFQPVVGLRGLECRA